MTSFQHPSTTQAVLSLVANRPELEAVEVRTDAAFRLWLASVATSAVMFSRKCSRGKAIKIIGRQGTRLLFGSADHGCAFCNEAAQLAGAVVRPNRRVLIYLVCEQCLQANGPESLDALAQSRESEIHGAAK